MNRTFLSVLYNNHLQNNAVYLPLKKNLMKKSFLLIAFAVVAIVSCTKTTNNTTVISPLPAFTVNGITDVTFTNGTNYFISMPLSVQYDDSAQETVALSVSGLPAGITMDTLWVNRGIPSFSTVLSLSDTLLAGGNPGTYPVSVVATGSKTGVKTYTFNLNVVSPASCTSAANILGTYTSCYGCSTPRYIDNVTGDPNITNKIWFANVYGTGVNLFGYYNCSTHSITVPAQTLNGVTYFGLGSASWGSGYHSISLTITNSSSGTCNVTLN